MIEINKYYKVIRQDRKNQPLNILIGKCIKVYKDFGLIDFGLYKETFRHKCENDTIYETNNITKQQLLKINGDKQWN